MMVNMMTIFFFCIPNKISFLNSEEACLGTVLVYNIIKDFPELNDKFIWKGRIQPEKHIIGV